MKSWRQSQILDVIDKEAVASQEELRHRLVARGINATQATISRDLKELGLVKRAGDGARSVEMKDYIRSRTEDFSAPIALVETTGEISDGTAGDSLFGGNDGIASDDLSKAIDEAAKDKAV